MTEVEYWLVCRWTKRPSLAAGSNAARAASVASSPDYGLHLTEGGTVGTRCTEPMFDDARRRAAHNSRPYASHDGDDGLKIVASLPRSCNG